MLIRKGSVKAEALARGDSACATGSLIGRGLGDGCDDEALHAGPRVVARLLGETAVYHVDNAIDRQRGFGDVCRYNYFPSTWRCRLENFGLHI